MDDLARLVFARRLLLVRMNGHKDRPPSLVTPVPHAEESPVSCSGGLVLSAFNESSSNGGVGL